MDVHPLAAVKASRGLREQDARDVEGVVNWGFTPPQTQTNLAHFEHNITLFNMGHYYENYFHEHQELIYAIARGLKSEQGAEPFPHFNHYPLTSPPIAAIVR